MKNSQNIKNLEYDQEPSSLYDDCTILVGLGLVFSSPIPADLLKEHRQLFGRYGIRVLDDLVFGA
jgi:hypothetical protein